VQSDLDLAALARIGDGLVGELREEVGLEHHEVDVLVDDDAGGVLVGEERVDAPAEGFEERFAALKVGLMKTFVAMVLSLFSCCRCGWVVHARSPRKHEELAKSKQACQ